ncbi:MAG: hypothetical protein N2Z79_03400 [Candidatus Omnitrophica bacterium]|nr:hypothetical protein [Candidatus Omnitrophota bacterium]
MTKNICKKHKYVAKRIELLKLEEPLPVECFICDKLYFSDYPLIFRIPSFKDINLCNKCQEKISCSKCKKEFNLKNFFVSECIQCNKIEFFCSKCVKKYPLLPNLGDSQGKILKNIQKIIKKYIPHVAKNQEFKSISDIKKLKEIKELPAYLFLHFNIILPAEFGPFEEDEDDWWRK